MADKCFIIYVRSPIESLKVGSPGRMCFFWFKSLKLGQKNDKTRVPERMTCPYCAIALKLIREKETDAGRYITRHGRLFEHTMFPP